MSYCCIRCELEALRQKMSATHAQSIQQALKTLALQKDAAMSEARRNWEREESSLKHKVDIIIVPVKMCMTTIFS